MVQSRASELCLKASHALGGLVMSLFLSHLRKQTLWKFLPARLAALVHVTEIFPVPFQMQANLRGHKR